MTPNGKPLLGPIRLLLPHDAEKPAKEPLHHSERAIDLLIRWSDGA